MALDMLVDSTQLDAGLTSVADAIRAKGGTSEQLAFPAGFVSAIGAIPTGGGVPTLGPYHVCMGQYTPSASGGFDIYVNVGENIAAVKFGVIWLNDTSNTSAYSDTSIVLASMSAILGGYATIDHLYHNGHQVQSKTAYGLKISRSAAQVFRFQYASHANWLGQPETYNYFGIYTV